MKRRIRTSLMAGAYLAYLPYLGALAIALGAVLVATPSAHADLLRSTPPAAGADLAFDQRINAALPANLRLRDAQGNAVRLGDYFGKVPIVLVLGYYHCPNLCSTLLDGVVEGLTLAQLPPSEYRLVAVSIDPREGPADAARRKAAYASLLGDMHTSFLTGSREATAALAKTVGFHYRWDAEQGQYMHPSGFAIVTPQGRISRYFLGVRFEPKDLHDAVELAADGRAASPVQRLLLLCSHYDPAKGHSGAVMAALRFFCLLLLVGLAVWIWRRGRAHRSGL